MDAPHRPPFAPEMPSDLTQAILARTSGSPCQRLQDLACAYVDDELDEGQSSLVRSHLGHCTTCSALVRALAMHHQVLPTLAEVNPGPWFTQRVLRATVHQPRSLDLRTTWWKLMHRPRIALEAAYLGAAAGLVGSYLPLPAPNFTARIPALVQPLSASAQRVAGHVVQAERRASASLQQGWRPAVPQTPRGLWRRVSTRIRSWHLTFRKAPPRSTAEEKTPPPANP